MRELCRQSGRSITVLFRRHSSAIPRRHGCKRDIVCHRSQTESSMAAAVQMIQNSAGPGHISPLNGQRNSHEAHFNNPVARPVACNFCTGGLYHDVARNYRKTAGTDRPLASDAVFFPAPEVRGDRRHRCLQPIVLRFRGPKENGRRHRAAQEGSRVTGRKRRAAAEHGVGRRRRRCRRRGQQGVGGGGGGVSIGTSIFTSGANKTGRGLAIYVSPEVR